MHSLHMVGRTLTVEQVVKGDKAAQEMLPKVMQDKLTVQSDTKRRAKRIAIILDHDDSNKRRGRAGHGPGRRAQGVDSASDTRLEI